MERRSFLGSVLSGTLVQPMSLPPQEATSPADVAVERPAQAQPHRGKVLALITPHLDDGPIFAGGTLMKLLKEGYTGYFIRTSNDEKDSYHRTLGETVLANEQDTQAFVKAAGLKKAFDLSYRNHRVDDVCRTEIRARLIFLFRLLKVDTVLSYDPWGHYEENPDHYVTAQAVEAACWMAGGRLDMPEHLDAGLAPHSVSEKYYFARGPQLVNRVVDIAPTISHKQTVIRSCRTMILHMIRDLNEELAGRRLHIPALTGAEDAAIDDYIKAAFVARDRSIGQKHGLEYAEEFHYIGPDPALNAYISQNAVSI